MRNNNHDNFEYDDFWQMAAKINFREFAAVETAVAARIALQLPLTMTMPMLL